MAFEDFEELPDISDDNFAYQLFSHEVSDEYAQFFFDEFIFGEHTDEERQQLFDDLCDYLFDEYGIDFYDVFDWEDFRDWYDSA